MRVSFAFKFLTGIISCSSSFIATAATPTGESSSFRVKEVISPPRGWNQIGTPRLDHVIKLRIGLPQPNFPKLEQHLLEVSHPDHERYGQYLSKVEVERLVAPSQSSINAVNSWLASHGFEEGSLVRSPAKDWVTLDIPLGKVEKMLNTTYQIWKHEHTGDITIRTTGYSLPEKLHNHVDVIQPTTIFGRFKKSKSTIFWPNAEDVTIKPAIENLTVAHTKVNGVAVDASCNTTITVSCLQQLYNAVGIVPSANIGNSIGITGYLGEFANIQDLQSFFADQRPDALNSSFDFISVNGGLNSQNLSQAGAEANLDVQFAFGISHPIPATFFSTAGEPPFLPDVGTPDDTNEPYTEWLDFVLAQEKLPLAISTSYGDDEQTGEEEVTCDIIIAIDSDEVPKSFAMRVCAGFAQLGARGISLMVSSGDGGVGDGDPDPVTQECFTNDGRNVTRFIPGFPASCPFVTAVGGTANIPEVAVSRFFSGGGFSDFFPRPVYQEKVVRRYLETLPKGLYEGLFNPAGRAFPDVSAQSDRFRIFLQGRPVLIGGTSASSPAFTGFVALLNDARLKAGKSPLGFLNPLIYSRGAAGFNDITLGHNAGCGTPGFNATKGWDPVTGFGTPDFQKLKSIVLG